MPKKPVCPKQGDIIDERDIYARRWCKSCKTNTIMEQAPSEVFQKIIPIKPKNIPCCDNPDYSYYMGTETLVTGNREYILKNLVPNGIIFKECIEIERTPWICRIQEKILGKVKARRNQGRRRS